MGIAAYNRGTRVILAQLRIAEDAAREAEDLLRAIVQAEKLEGECRNIRERIATVYQRKGIKGAYIARAIESRSFQSRMDKVRHAEEAWRNSPGPVKRPMRHLALVAAVHKTLTDLETWMKRERLF